MKATAQIADTPEERGVPTIPRFRFLRKSAVEEMTGLSDTTIWRLERLGGFPKRIAIHGNIVGWLESDIVQWMRKKVEEAAH